MEKCIQTEKLLEGYSEANTQMEEQFEQSAANPCEMTFLVGAEAEPSGNVAHAASSFYESVASAISEATQKVMTEAQHFNTVLSTNMTIELSKVKHRHLEEQSKLFHEIKDLQHHVDVLQSCLAGRCSIIENMAEKLQRQQNMALLAKVISSWRMYVQRKKREKLLSAFACKHYEAKLKRRALSHWYDQMKINWKKRMELKANLDVLITQKGVVAQYEAKIKNLEENLSDASRITSILQSKLNSYEDLAKPPVFQKSEPFIVNPRYFQTDELLQRIEFEGMNRRQEEAMNRRQEQGTYLCSDCSSLAYVGPSNRYYNCYTPPVNYITSQEETMSEIVPSKSVHSSSQSQSLPVMGTARHQYYKTSKASDSVPKSSKPDVIVERHVRRAQLPTVIHPRTLSRPASAKLQSFKKLV